MAVQVYFSDEKLKTTDNGPMTCMQHKSSFRFRFLLLSDFIKDETGELRSGLLSVVQNRKFDFFYHKLKKLLSWRYALYIFSAAHWFMRMLKSLVSPQIWPWIESFLKETNLRRVCHAKCKCSSVTKPNSVWWPNKSVQEIKQSPKTGS